MGFATAILSFADEKVEFAVAEVGFAVTRGSFAEENPYFAHENLVFADENWPFADEKSGFAGPKNRIFLGKRLASRGFGEHKAAQNINPDAGMAFYDTPGLFFDSGALYDDASASQPTRKRMAKVKVGLRGFSREQIADKIDTVKTAMTGNANFPWLIQLR